MKHYYTLDEVISLLGKHENTFTARKILRHKQMRLERQSMSMKDQIMFFCVFAFVIGVLIWNI